MDRVRKYYDLTSKYEAEPVTEGKLTGTTDTDYFNFLCPRCDGGGSHIMRILSYGQLADEPFKYTELRPKTETTFRMCFELYCPDCRLHTVVKLANDGRQGGTIMDVPSLFPHRVIGPNEKT